MMIHAITLIEDLPKKDEYGIIDIGDLYRVGFCTQKDEALHIVEENFTGDKDWCFADYNRYKYCIIETLMEGVPAISVAYTLFKWEDGQFIRLDSCEEPMEFRRFSNFCMG